MQKYLAIFGILVLVGAGCSAQTTQKSDATINERTSETTQPAAEQPANSGLVVTPVTLEETVVTADDGTQLVIETSPVVTEPAPTPKEEENVIDVSLGEDVGQTIQMETGNFFFSPKTITAKTGERIKITFTKNSGFHTFVLDELDLKAAISAGENLIFTAPTKPGSYPFYCDIGSHRSMGMEGTLIVK